MREMIVHKTWVMYEASRDDVDVLIRAKTNFNISHPKFSMSSTLLNNSGLVVNYELRSEIMLYTENEEQEFWLKLNFGDRLVHLSTEYEFYSQ